MFYFFNYCIIKILGERYGTWEWWFTKMLTSSEKILKKEIAAVRAAVGRSVTRVIETAVTIPISEAFQVTDFNMQFLI